MIDLIVELAVESYDGVVSFFRREAWLVIKDVIDVGLVATLFYWVLVVLKGTRAMQMAIGLGVILGGYMMARKLGLITIWAILDSMLTYIVLIVVVIFQNDIRRALMRVGGRPFFRNQRTARETQMIEEVIKAATALAQKRIGALVVFERGAQLDEFIESGTELDAAVTKELLYSIFIPSFENPMHDGAVVIRDGRVWRAGTFLPVTGTSSHDRTLGARHRAAIGISLETDAVVVVVSEERGAVSLCFGGNVVRNLDAGSLREALFGLFYRPKRTTAKSTGRTSSSSKERRSTPEPEPAEGRTSRELPTTGRHSKPKVEEISRG